MANIKSARKRVVQAEKRRKINKMRMNSIRSFVKKIMLCIEKKDKSGAQEAFKVAQPALMKGANKGILHSNTVSRRLSRLSKKIKALGA